MAKAKDRVADVKPYVQRAIQDEELRDNLRSAFATARDVYDELIGGRRLARSHSKVASEKDIPEERRSAMEMLGFSAAPGPGRGEHQILNGSLSVPRCAL